MTTPEEFAWRKEIPGTIERPAEREGKVLYPAPDRVLVVVREWVIKAENDFTNAAHVLKLSAECPTDTVCFNAQQCVEKYLKALLVLDGIDFPKTHDIERLTALLPARADIRLTARNKEG